VNRSVARTKAKLLAVLLALGTAGQVAAADFEGVIESRIKMSGKASAAGTSRTFVSPAGTRQEMTFGAKDDAVTLVTLVLRSKPGLVYVLSDAKKTYTEMDPASLGGAGEKSSVKYTVRRIGSEKVAGQECTHGMVQGSNGDRWEVWAAKDITGADDFWAGQAGGQDTGSGATAGLARAMKEAGLDGWPVKWIARPKNAADGTMTWEAIRIDRRSLPASTFSLAGYARSEGGGPLGAAQQMKLSPAQQKELDDAMKDLSPEDRKQMEQLMKGMQGGARP
jgi:hypothetical protein